MFDTLKNKDTSILIARLKVCVIGARDIHETPQNVRDWIKEGKAIRRELKRREHVKDAKHVAQNIWASVPKIKITLS